MMRRYALLPAVAALLVTAPAPASSPTLSPLYPEAIVQQTLPGLTILLGETWIFRIEQGQPADARRAKPDDKPGDGEIMVTFDRGRGGAVMTVSNNSEEGYNYRAFISLKPNHKGNRTSVCTLLPGVQAVEIWPEPFAAIRLADFTEAADGNIRCA